MIAFPLSPGLSWLVGGLVLMVLEVLMPGTFMVWIGLAAICAGLATMWLDLPFAWEVVAFAAFAAVTIAIGLKLRRPRRAALVNTPGAGLVGRTARSIDFHGREGRVRLGDSDWPARLSNDSAIPAPSAPLEVVGIDGTILVVRQAAEAAGGSHA